MGLWASFAPRAFIAPRVIFSVPNVKRIKYTNKEKNITLIKKKKPNWKKRVVFAEIAAWAYFLAHPNPPISLKCNPLPFP